MNKYALTIKEASSYFNIGENKLRELIANESPVIQGCVLKVGVKTLIKREKFEKSLNQVEYI